MTQPFDRRAIPAVATESRWQAADGWSIRRIDWPDHDVTVGAVRGSILFMPGRGDIYEKYLETLHGWHEAGWRVTASDWRGQGGSGRGGEDKCVGHIDDFATWSADLGTFWKDWKAAHPGPHVLIGHSMGGHLISRAAMEGHVDPNAIVLSAPMLGVKGLGLPLAAETFIAKRMMGLGHPARAAWKVSEKPNSPIGRRQKLLTHDGDRYADEPAWWALRPELEMGPPSWQWVVRAYESIQFINAPGQWESIDCPVLIVATSADQLVSFKTIVQAANRLPNGELVRFGSEAAHEILREADPVRSQVLAAIDAFLNRVAPAESA